jgi:hypothetical protein
MRIARAPSSLPFTGLALISVLLAAGESPLAAAQTPVIVGTVQVRDGGTRLPGAVITVTGPSGVVAAVVADDTGAFAIRGLPPGRYEIKAELAGFDPSPVVPVTLVVGPAPDVVLLLSIAAIRQSVSVEAESAAPAERATAAHEIAADLVNVAPIDGDNFQALLPVLPGVLRGDDGRIRLNGGRPDQSGLQVSGASVTDPVTGDFGIELPTDAVQGLEVIASPYLSEFGRFSSGITRIETRRAVNDWQFTANNFVPIPRFRDRGVRGIRSFGPRFLVGGALVRDRLFLTESAQYELKRTRVPSLPDGENDRELQRFNTFTRIDAQASATHHGVVTLATFPRTQRYLTLGTFAREPVTADLRERGYQADIAVNSMVGPGLLESRLTYRRYDVRVDPQQRGPMVITPLEVRGRHFNAQDRDSHGLQWQQSMSLGWAGPTGDHRVKLGVDVLHGRYKGTSASQPVEVRDLDGGLRERITFATTRAEQADATDLAVFVQDRWRPHERLLLEFGGRLDRDGVLRRITPSPRLGGSLGVLPGGRGVLRGGIGRFVQRTPLLVAAFERFEPRIVEAVTGTVMLQPRRRVERTPRAMVTSVEYDHRLTAQLSLRLGHIRRDGTREYIVEPQAQAGAIVLTSDGRSRYRESEATLAYIDGERTAHLSYVKAQSWADYNGLDRYFGNLRQPLIRPNRFARTDIDVPHRVLLRGTWPLPGRLQLAPIIEVRSGFPYSLVDASQQFVGPQNEGGRFPVLATLDLAVNREVTIRGRRVRVGIRSHQLLNRFTPREVQNNVDSGAVGTFYNTIERRVGVTLQILP